AKVLRHGETIVPNGDVQLKVGDVIVLAGRSYFDVVGTDLLEFQINNHHNWVNKQIKNIRLERDSLIVLVLRGDNELIVPNGDTTMLDQQTDLVLEASNAK